MRVATSVYAIESALGKEQYKILIETYKASTGRSAIDGVGWHWVLNELEAPMPKSASGVLKVNPVQHLAIGLSRGHYELRLNARPEIGRVWVSDVLPRSIAPVEVALAVKKRLVPSAGNKWGGVCVEIFMPMHQKHPGLAEHAVVGGIRSNDGIVYCFVSDRPDPFLAPIWHIYRFHPSRRTAQALLSIVDRVGQKDFRSTNCGQDLVLRDYAGVKLTDDELVASFAGVSKFVWKTDVGSIPGAIPSNARKFKLGEELSSHESKSIPASALIGALGSVMK